MTQSIRGSVDFQPLPFYGRAQQELAWGFNAALGEMAPPSNMGPLTAMIEGGRGTGPGPDLVEDPWGALQEVLRRSDLRSAGRFRRFREALDLVGHETARVLFAVYGRPTDPTMWEAFKGAANLVPESEVAREHHVRARTSLEFFAWCARFATRVAGEPYKSPDIEGRILRRPPRATEAEKAAALDIKRDVETTLASALRLYAMSESRSDVETVRRTLHARSAKHPSRR